MPNNTQLWDQIDPPKTPIATFYQHPVFEKVVNGHKTYKLVDYIRLHVKGSNSSISKRATDQLKHEHREVYEPYKKRIDMGLYPLLCVCDKAVEKTLNELGIFSLNQLAESQPLPIYDEYRSKAIKIIEVRNETQNRPIQHNIQTRPTQENHQKENNKEKSPQKIGFSLPNLNFNYTL